MRIAWGDESASHAEVDPGAYILAAIHARHADAEMIRDRMGQLLRPGQRKLHWRQESPRRRHQIVKAIAELPVHGVVVVRRRLGEVPERRRRKCLERLLWELKGCQTLILESRGPADDARDRTLVDAMRRNHTLPRGLRVDHVVGPKDPALWVADAVCGAVSQERCGNPGYLETLRAGTGIRIIDVGSRSI